VVDTAGSPAGLSVEVLAHGQLVWVYVERPTPAETDYLHRRYGLHPIHLAECLTRRQQPKVAEHSDYLFVVLGAPVRNKLARATTSGEASVFLGPDYLVTVHHGDVRPLVRLFRECQGSEERRAEVMGYGPGYLLYAIADRLASQSLQAVEAVARDVQSAEEALLAEDDRGLAREFAFLRRDVAALRRLVRPQASALARLATYAGRSPLLGEDLSVHWASLAGRLEHLADSLEGCREAVEALAVGAESLAARRTRDAARLLAVVSATTLPLLVLTTLFGLNVKDLPLASHPYAFEFVLAALAAITVGALYLFRRSRWL